MNLQFKLKLSSVQRCSSASGFGLFISPGLCKQSHLLPSPSTPLSPDVHCTLALCSLFWPYTLALKPASYWPECFMRVTPFCTGHKASKHTHFTLLYSWSCGKTFQQFSHTLHATLDGALFIVIDLLLPSLTRSCWLSKTKKKRWRYWWNSRVEVTGFIKKAELPEKHIWWLCEMYALSHLSVFHIFTYIRLQWLEWGQCSIGVSQSDGDTLHTFMKVWPHSVEGEHPQQLTCLLHVSKIDLFLTVNRGRVWSSVIWGETVLWKTDVSV